jgi:hypothetical protein
MFHIAPLSPTQNFEIKVQVQATLERFFEVLQFRPQGPSVLILIVFTRHVLVKKSIIRLILG